MGEAEWVDLFAALCDLPPDQRQVRLREIAATNAGLSARLGRLLEADRKREGILDQGAVAVAGPDLALRESADPSVEKPPSDAIGADALVGPWRLLERLGSGGMGEVWLAERADGNFDRRVAIKLLKRGLDSDEIRRRFLLERRILARLEHPGIARLFDAGTTAEGQPYFVLEHVAGRPITQWARHHELDIDSRLRLLLAACDAVDYAQRNLVVHRDLKPSNMLVTESGQLKLLDFGIAKLLEGSPGDGATRAEQRMMTPDYAAPEQILGETITTATDVYALGVLLFELLTGNLPHRRAGSQAAWAGSLEREIVERPSVTVRRAAVARVAGLDTARWSRRLAGDLDNIVLKALAREPERRYPSAAALGDDLRRHLGGLPIGALPDTLGYRAAKFARRHRLAVSAAAVAISALVVGLGVAIWQAHRAAAAAEQAAAAARRSERVKGLLVATFQRVDPFGNAAASTTARELLDRGAKQVEAELAAEPEVAAELLSTLSGIYRSLDLQAEAQDLAERSLRLRRQLYDPDHPEVGVGLATLGNTLYADEQRTRAQPVLRHAIRLLEGVADQPAYALELARAKSSLWGCLRFEDPRAAIHLQREAHALLTRELGEAHPETADQLQSLGVALEEIEEYAEAEAAQRQALSTLIATLGEGHPKVGRVRVLLAGLLDRVGKREEASEQFESGLEILRPALGSRHAEVGQTLFSYGIFLQGSRRFAEAEGAFLEALAIFGADSADGGHCLRYLGHALLGLNRPEEAAARFAAAEDNYRRTLGERHGEVFRATGDRGYARLRLGDPRGAVQLLHRAVEGISAAYGAESYQIVRPLTLLGETHRVLAEYPQAIERHRQARAVDEKLFGPRYFRLAHHDYELALDLRARGARDDAAETLRLLDQAKGLLREVAPQDPRLAEIELLLAKSGASAG